MCSAAWCSTMSICRCQNSSMHAACFICHSCCRYSPQRGRQSTPDELRGASCAEYPSMLNRIVPDAPRQIHICPRHSQLSVIAHAIAWVLLFLFLFSPDCPFISLRFCRVALSTPCQQSKWPKSRPLSTFVSFHVGSSSKSAMSRVTMAGVNLHWRVIHSPSKAVSIR